MKKTNVVETTLNVDVRDENVINEELYVGMIVSDTDITNQYSLSMLYNGRTENSDYTDIFDYVLDGKSSIIIRYEKNYITKKEDEIFVLDEKFLSIFANSETPILLKNKGNGFNGFMSIIIPDYRKEEYDLAIGAITSDEPIIIIQEAKTGCIAIVNAYHSYLLGGIISRTIEKMKKIAEKRTEEKLEFKSVIMPHRRHIDIPTTYAHKLAIYLYNYLNNVNMKNIYGKGDEGIRIYLSVIDAIVCELQKYMGIENITICDGVIGDRDLKGELLYGSEIEAKRDNAYLKSSYDRDNTLSNESRNILRRNIIKRNMVFLRKL